MKKLTSLILCGALCAGILVGCGKTDGNTTASSSTAAATEATTEATTEAVAPSYESAQALLESIHKAMPDDAEFPAAEGGVLGGDFVNGRFPGMVLVKADQVVGRLVHHMDGAGAHVQDNIIAV